MDPQNSAPVAVWFADRLYWVFLGLMFINILQRKHHQKAQKKRMATLLLGVSMFALLLAAQTINHFGGSDIVFYLAVVLFSVVVYRYRDNMLPFRLRSTVDGRWLQFQEIFFDDSHGENGDQEERDEEPDQGDTDR